MRKRGQLLTIWTGERVYLILFKSDQAHHPSIVHLSLDEKASPVESYLDAGQRLLEGAKPGTVENIWIVLRESYPYGSFEDNGDSWNIIKDTQLGECCRSLPDTCLPRFIFSGVDVMKTMIAQHEDIWKPGQGAVLDFGEKLYFLGYGEDEPFARISRRPLEMGRDRPIGEDWLQQTSMLYQNQTGYQLKLIFLFSQDPIQPYKSKIHGINVESLSPHVGDAVGLQDFPLSGLLSLLQRNSPLNRIRLDVLDQRKCWADLVHGFRLGVALLLFGGCLLLVAACRSGALGHSVDTTSQEQWQKNIAQWELANRMWKEKSTRVRNRRLAILLAGEIAGSLPEQVQLRRLQINKSAYPEASMDMILEGEIASATSSSNFQSWVDSLVDAGVLGDVRNLQYEPSGKNLEFQLHAFSRGKDSP